MPPEADAKKDKQTSAIQAREVIDVFHEISTLLVHFYPASGKDMLANHVCRTQTLTDRHCLSVFRSLRMASIQRLLL